MARKPAWHEFHFRRDDNATWRAFHTAVTPLAFTNYAVVMQKNRTRTPSADAMFISAMARLFATARAALQRAIVLVDGGDRQCCQRLVSVVRGQVA